MLLLLEMKWIDALKAWNQKNPDGHWCVPRKGTKDHAEVKAMMGPPQPKPAKKTRTRKLAAADNSDSDSDESFISKESNPRRNLKAAKAKAGFDATQVFSKGVLGGQRRLPGLRGGGDDLLRRLRDY